MLALFCQTYFEMNTLPIETLDKIAQFLPLKDIVQLSLSCALLHKACNRVVEMHRKIRKGILDDSIYSNSFLYNYGVQFGYLFEVRADPDCMATSLVLFFSKKRIISFENIKKLSFMQFHFHTLASLIDVNHYEHDIQLWRMIKLLLSWKSDQGETVDPSGFDDVVFRLACQIGVDEMVQSLLCDSRGTYKRLIT